MTSVITKTVHNPKVYSLSTNAPVVKSAIADGVIAKLPARTQSYVNALMSGTRLNLPKTALADMQAFHRIMTKYDLEHDENLLKEWLSRALTHEFGATTDAFGKRSPASLSYSIYHLDPISKTFKADELVSTWSYEIHLLNDDECGDCLLILTKI